MTDQVLYIPLLSSQANTLVDPSASARVLFREWDVAQLASVAVIQNLPALDGKAKSEMLIEQALADLISIGTELSTTHPPGTFSNLMASKFKRELFERGLALMPRLQVRFLDEDTLAAQQFLSGGRWDFNFCAAHTRKLNPLKHSFETSSGEIFSLSNQQSRTFRIIHAEPDESIHIQGLAGTGKTHMIERLVGSLSSCRPLVLAFTAVQLQALMLRIGAGNVRGMTFGDLANYVLERDPGYSRPGKRASARYQLTPQDIASRLGFGGISWLSPAQVASTCATMVASFCGSTDFALTEQHIPKGLSLNAVDRLVLVENAQRLWDQTIEPTHPRFQLPLRGYHRIKHMTLLHEAVIGSEFTHVIVDEAHDLSWPLSAFLDRCSQPVITLGDACQRLDGRFYHRASTLRKHEITHSIRAGRQIEGVINPLIDKHPVLKLASIEGNNGIETKVTYYDKPEIPTGAVTILVDSEWGLFEWFQRLGSAGASFSLLPGSVNAFRRFILDCIGLFHEQARPSHSALFRYTSWDDLRADMSSKNSSFQRIDRMLSKGYSSVEFEASLLSLDASGAAPLKLGRVMDARNSEIDAVMLAPDLLSQVGPGDRIAASMAFAALYTGGSRARHRLIVPGYLRDWASDMSTIAKAQPASSP
ncbi:AAA family ATPase (plasmid) [Pseudomonas corrugata]|uniref:helicase n=1 Tax=Pseudomonas corrugata TaxID=47879 RepID=UPI003D81981E